MNLQLIISDASPSDLSRVIAALGAGNVAITSTLDGGPSPAPAPAVSPTGNAPIPPAPIPMPAAISSSGTDDDDEAGDTTPTGNNDSTGMPWDERIHSHPAKLTGKGVWRKRRGVDDATVTAIEAELRARSAPPMPVPTAPIPAPVAVPTPVTTPPPPPMPMPATGEPAPAPVAPPMPLPVSAPVAAPAVVAAPEPVAAPSADPTDFQSFMLKLSQLMAARMQDGSPMIHADYLVQLASRIATAANRVFNAVTDLQQQPEMIPYVISVIKADGRWQ